MLKRLAYPLYLGSALAITLAALALRLHGLQFQSLWWDEGISLYLAGTDLRTLTTVKDFAVDLHPPLYHALLMAWTSALGSSVFSARLLSTALGTLLVPVTITLGRMYAGRLAAIVAGLLVAISPFLVFYSQESRMYTLVPLLGVLSTLLVARVIRSGRLTFWSGFALALVNLAALYSYYYLGLLVLAENLAVLVVTLAGPGRLVERKLSDRLRRLFLPWVIVQVVTALGYAPWLVMLLRLATRSSDALGIPATDMVSYTPLGFARETLLSFVVGFSRAPTWATVAVGATVALAVFGLLGRGRAGQRWLLGLCFAVPLVASYALLLWRPFFYPRFVIYVAPLLSVLAAAGLARLLSPLRAESAARAFSARSGRTSAAAALGALALALLLWPCVPSLRSQYSTPRTAYSSSDYTVALRDLAAWARPGDLLLATYPWQLGYVRGYLPRAGLTPRLVAGANDRGADVLASAVAVRPRSWMMLYSPDGKWGENPAETTLRAAHSVAFFDQHGDTRLELFADSPLPDTQPPLATLGGNISLLGVAPQPTGVLRPGDTLDLALTWRATTAPGADYTVFTHAIGPDGKVYGQHDSPPGAGAWPTSRWQAGGIVVDRHALTISPDAPNGDYYVEVGMYLPSTGARLAVGRSPEEPDRVIIGRFRVAR